VIPRHFQITIALVLLAILVSGVIIIRMTHKEEALTLQTAEAAPAAPMVDGKQEHIQLLLAYDDDQALRWRGADVFLPADRNLRARETLRAVLAQYLQTPSPQPLAKGAERAAAISKTKKVVVAATEATVASHAYQRALEQRGMQATEKACPLFVPLVEEGWVDHRVTEEVAHIYMDEVFRDGARAADVLVLGCTHYPLIRGLLRRVVPQSVEIVDSAESTASKVVELLGADRGQGGPGDLRCYATDSVEKFSLLVSKYQGCPIDKIELVDIEK
jgi:glutamate racemase